MSDLTKITLNLTAKTYDALDRGHKQAGFTKTDFINRSIQLYEHWLQEEAAGRTVWIREGNEFARIKLL
jgi:hypothetical protein